MKRYSCYFILKSWIEIRVNYLAFWIILKLYLRFSIERYRDVTPCSPVECHQRFGGMSVCSSGNSTGHHGVTFQKKLFFTLMYFVSYYYIFGNEYKFTILRHLKSNFIQIRKLLYAHRMGILWNFKLFAEAISFISSSTSTGTHTYPTRIFIRVDLPAPEGPRIAVSSPARNLPLTALRIVRLPAISKIKIKCTGLWGSKTS
jgi:hypothetical protein